MRLFDILGTISLSAPFLAIAAILAHARLRRALWARRHGLVRPAAGLVLSVASFGLAFQHLQVFYRPGLAYVLEAERDDDTGQDTSGEPETPVAFFARQLRRIRRGEPVERLVWRL